MTTCRVLCLTVLVAGLSLPSRASGSEPVDEPKRASLMIVAGAAGTDEYERMFDRWSTEWQASATAGDAEVHLVDSSEGVTQRHALQQTLLALTDGSARPLWIVLIGHGTFDGREAKFNLTGPDVSASELAEWLEPVQRPIAVINGSSASSPFIEQLSLPGRVIVTATRSGSEVNFARFSGFIAGSIVDVASDLDKDGQVSLLEAFLTASRQTATHYDGLGQLATEHALLEDTGDGRGVGADFFEGLRPVKAAAGGETLDGHLAHQWYLVPSDEERRFPEELRPRRDELERETAHLRDRKADLDEDAYYVELEALLVELASLYDRAEEMTAEDAAGKTVDAPKAESGE